MTTNDIESATIYLKMKDGQTLAGQVEDNPILFSFLACYVKFAAIDPDLVGTLQLSHIIKKETNGK